MSRIARLIAVLTILAGFVLIWRPASCYWLRNQVALDLPTHLMNGFSFDPSSSRARESLSQLSSCSSATEFLGRVYFWSGDSARVRTLFSASSELAGVHEWLFVLGVNATAQGDYALAERALRLYVDLLPDSGEGYLRLGILYHHQGDYEAARTFYLTAIKTDPALTARGYFSIGQTYLETHQAIEGMVLLQKALQIDANDQSLYVTERMAANYWIGVGHVWQNDLQNAEAYLRRAIRIGVSAGYQEGWVVCGSRSVLGNVLHQQGRPVEATEVLQQVIMLCDEHPKEVRDAQAELEAILK